MKKTLFSLLIGVVLSCAQSSTNAQKFDEHLHKEFEVSKTTTNILAIYNINGFVKVEGYAGDKVVIEVDKNISARDEDDVETGKKEFQLAFEQKGDSIIAYVAQPFDSRPNRNYERRNDKRVEYHYNVSYSVKVPYNMNLHISTINNGYVEVKDVAGALHLRNINGEISVANAKGQSNLHTINGNITINYVSNPPEPSSYYTLNGDIRVTYLNDLSADLQFKSMNGHFYTDFSNTEVLPTQVVKNKETRGDGTVYKLNKTSSIRIGSGGKAYRFETMNGSVYIKKQQ